MYHDHNATLTNISTPRKIGGAKVKIEDKVIKLPSEKEPNKEITIRATQIIEIGNMFKTEKLPVSKICKYIGVSFQEASKILSELGFKTQASIIEANYEEIKGLIETGSSQQEICDYFNNQFGVPSLNALLIKMRKKNELQKIVSPISVERVASKPETKKIKSFTVNGVKIDGDFSAEDVGVIINKLSK